MKLNLHIERLVLNGLPLSGSQGAVVQAAVESELKHLLAAGDLGHLKSGASPYSSAPPVQLAPEAKPLGLGRQIAKAVHDALAPNLTGPRESLGQRRGSI
jgi:hypothetical protein